MVYYQSGFGWNSLALTDGLVQYGNQFWVDQTGGISCCRNMLLNQNLKLLWFGKVWKQDFNSEKLQSCKWRMLCHDATH